MLKFVFKLIRCVRLSPDGVLLAMLASFVPYFLHAFTLIYQFYRTVMCFYTQTETIVLFQLML